jgi:hypothetical protein
MVFEHLEDYFHLKDSTSEFPQLFQLCFHIAQGHVPLLIACVLRATHLLTMTKPLNGVHPIAIGETLYQLTSRILYFQLCKTIATHFSPHQFGITTKGGCETIIHGIRCTLNLHLD